MSNYEVNAFLKIGFPPDIKLSSTARFVFVVLCHRYDTRPGQNNSYPGMAELMRTTGKSRQTVQDALADLLKAGVITQIQKGYRTKRAEYVPCYAVSLVQLGRHSVGYSVTNKLTGSAIPADSVSNTDLMSKPYRHKVSSKPYTISTINTDKYDKYDKHNRQRFDFILTGLKASTKATIKPGINYEVRLDELERQGITLEAIRATITATDFSNAGKVGALLDHVLNHIGRPETVQPAQVIPEWCGRAECDKDTRKTLLPSPIPKGDGAVTRSCLKCSPDMVRGTRTTQPPAFSNQDQPRLNPPAPEVQALLDKLSKPVPRLDYEGLAEV